MQIKEKIAFLDQAFHLKFPEPKTELEFETPFQLLISTLLAAQCTDARVNKVTETLFRVAPNPVEMIKLTETELQEIIHSVNYYKTKAKHVLETSRLLIERFDGQVPTQLEDLQQLPGVGRKTASVVRICAFGLPSFPVDTHVFRVANRIGVAKAVTVEKTESQLRKRIPEADWYRFHYYFILHGRYTCKAQKPDCESCEVKKVCLFWEQKLSKR